MMARHRGTLAAAVIILVTILDQWLKIYIKTNFYLGEDVEITSWFHLYFVQNPGMAFGWEMGSKLFVFSHSGTSCDMKYISYN